MSITKAKLRTLRNEMQAALDKAGITDFELEVGNMRFTDATVTIKVEGKLKGAVTREDRAVEGVINMHNLVKRNSKGDVITGYNSRAHKYPYMYVNGTDGKTYKTDLTGLRWRFKEGS